MLAQEVFAVIVAIGGANDKVDVVFVGLLILGKGDAPLMVKLDDQHGAMDAVVKYAVLFHASHPCEMGHVEMPLHLSHF